MKIWLVMYIIAAYREEIAQMLLQKGNVKTLEEGRINAEKSFLKFEKIFKKHNIQHSFTENDLQKTRIKYGKV